MKSENWRRWIPTDIDPKPTGHTQECEDSEGNVCICGKAQRTNSELAASTSARSR